MNSNYLELTPQAEDQRAVYEDSYSLLIQAAPEFLRARTDIEHGNTELASFRTAHPELYRPSPYAVATHLMVLIGLPAVAVLEFLFVSGAAEYAAGLFFSGSRFFAQLAKVVIPVVIVALEVKLAIVIDTLKQCRLLNGSNPERAFFVILGWLMIFMTPLIILATFLVGDRNDNLGFPVFMLSQMLVSGVMEAMIIKNGRLIRLAFAWMIFKLKCRYLQHRLRDAKKRYDQAAATIHSVFPILAGSLLALRASSRNLRFFIALPSDLIEALQELFGDSALAQLDAHLVDLDSPRVTSDISGGNGNRKAKQSQIHLRGIPLTKESRGRL